MNGVLQLNIYMYVSLEANGLLFPDQKPSPSQAVVSRQSAPEYTYIFINHTLNLYNSKLMLPDGA